jgi:zinc protease
LNRAKNKVVADHVFAQEAAENQASQLASDWVATGDPYFSDAYVSRIQGVAPEDLRRVARKYLTKDRMTLAVVKPPSAPSQESKPEPTETLGAGIEKKVLSNQMTLLLKKNTAAPIVVLEFLVKGGLRFEPTDKPGLSRFTASLLTKGTANRNKFEIAKTVEDLGGSIKASSGNNVVSLSVSVLKEHFDVALDLLADVALRPSFPENETQKQRQDTLMAIKKLDEQWTTEVSRLFKRHFYRKHPYRNHVLGSVEAVEGFSAEDIRGFYKSVMMPNNAVLAIFGDIEPDTVTAKVEKAFEDFRPRILEQPIIEIETDNIGEDETFETFNEKTSTGIFFGYNGLTLEDRDSPVADVVDAIISGIGYPSGWLHDALRGGEQNLVYFVHAYPAFGIDGGYFGIMTQTAPENYEQVLKIVLEQMALVRQSEVDATTLELAKNMCITMHELGLETIAAQAASAALNEVLGLGYDYNIKYPALIDKVDAEDVLRVARKLFSHHLIVTTKPKDR